jgi:hypothetical protein
MKVRSEVILTRRSLFLSLLSIEKADEMLDFIVKSMDECRPSYFISLKLRNKQYIKMNRAKLSMTQLNEYLEKKLIEFGE